MPRLFGTNGVRGVVGETMTSHLALELGKAIGACVEPCTFAVGTDARTSADMLKMAVAAGLQSAGHDVMDTGVVPTPALQYFVRNGGADMGVVITASHNPPQFNGIKVIAEDGTELPREREALVERAYHDKKFRRAAWDRTGGLRRVSEVAGDYVRGVLSQVDVKGIGERAFRVAIDCANGAGSLTGPAIMERLCPKVVSLNCHQSGTFPGHQSEPTEENLRDLQLLVRGTDLDLGVAMDGDADRAVFFDGSGNFVTGDKILALLSRKAVEDGGEVVVTPVSSSSLVEDVVTRAGGRVEYTRVGAPIVSRRMMEIRASFGGEENGGMIFPSFQYCRDAGMTAAAVLELLRTSGKSLEELVKGLPRYHTVKSKVEVPDERKSEVMERYKKALEGADLDLTDGIKLLEGDGWTLVRPSGTEPIIRIYAESKDEDRARKMSDRAVSLLNKCISGNY